MSYAAQTIWPLIALAVAIGFAVGILYWRARSKAIGGWSARLLAEREVRIEELEALSSDHAASVAALHEDLHRARSAASAVEGKAAELIGLRTRVSEAEAAAAGARVATARVRELEQEIAALREQAGRSRGGDSGDEQVRGELRAAEGRVASLTTRITELERESAGLRERAEALAERAGTAERLREDLRVAEARTAAAAARVTELERVAARVPELERAAARVPELERAAARPAERERVAPRPAEPERRAGEPDPVLIEPEGRNGGAEPETPRRAPVAAERPVVAASTQTMHRGPERTAPVVDVEVGSRVLGIDVRLDDLKIIEGIGPKIEEICRTAGIRTWRDLAAASPTHLREVLLAAGPGFRVHEPKSWPVQARLLAEGRWTEFAELAESLSGGRGGRGGHR